jgi:hypothetical protein
MFFVDQANQYIKTLVNGQESLGNYHVAGSECKEIFESSTGNSDIRGPSRKKMVRKTLLGLPTFDTDLHPVL